MNKVKPIAIYLPQFHPIPENNKAWGEGFTDWTNVKKAKPLFDEHYQPHVPHRDIGYYDLLDPAVLVRQAAMAREHGIFGFAYYHYWFNGKRLLNQPLDNMISMGKPDFPFCFIWANENWTKRWDGQDNEIIIRQEYSFEDDLRHIKFLCEKVFSDRRYITIDGKPLFMVYRTELFPDINRTVQIWRDGVRSFGFQDIYLVRVESLTSDIKPASIGFDSAMEFAPDWRVVNQSLQHVGSDLKIAQYDYSRTVLNMLSKKKEYKYFRCVFPSWDNTPRRRQNPVVFVNTSLFLFKYFLYRSIHYTYKNFKNDEQLIFINAWNEWGEGCHIEPDERFGLKYLELCNEVITGKYNYQEEENLYFELLENRIENLHSKNLFLEQKVLDLSQKIDNFLRSIDYKIGQKFLNPYRLLRQFLKI